MKNLTKLILLIQLSYLASAGQCDEHGDRKDCGYRGINQDQCETEKNCCWNPSSVDGVNWCYFPEFQLNFTATDPKFTEKDYSNMEGRFNSQLNMFGLGSVVAAPDNSTPGGTYWFHWERDGALSMKTYMQINDYNYDKIHENMDSYIGWVVGNQKNKGINGSDIRCEPKYYLTTGKPFDGPWCRPQNDGPGLRGYTLIKYAEVLNSQGATQKKQIKEFLWTDSSSYNGGAIKYDLDWIEANWQTNGCDLWEEVESTNFFWNRMAHRQSMIAGAKFAKTMGDKATSEKYQNAADQITKTLTDSKKGHYQNGYVYESNNRLKDAAVIGAFVELYMDDGVYGPLSEEVVRTIIEYNDAFYGEYHINEQDTAAHVPGILYGRYPGDTYAGGNPWVLTTAYLASCYYHAARELSNQNGLWTMTPEIKELWNKALDTKGLDNGIQFAAAMRNAGDSILARIHYHTNGDDFRLDEQLDKQTGFQLSARSLTWSYATVLDALHTRKSL